MAAQANYIITEVRIEKCFNHNVSDIKIWILKYILIWYRSDPLKLYQKILPEYSTLSADILQICQNILIEQL